MVTLPKIHTTWTCKQQISSGQYLTQQDLEKESENWYKLNINYFLITRETAE